ncbi:hypothetical protein SMA60_26750, partial [Escherichia coli]|uniref:hypothetical protein n=1 Tax=Escherichia coli TaxID=562 RepID=UPI00307A698F
IEKLSMEDDFLLSLIDTPGPLALLRGEPAGNNIELAARITARYGKQQSLTSVKVSVRQAKEGAPQKILQVTPLDQENIDRLMIRKIPNH